MLHQVHEHVVSELTQSTRTDTVFVVTAIVFNLTMLGVNSGVASDSNNEWIFWVFMIVTLLINIIAVAALYLGRRTSRRLLDGLILMYKDNDVDKYYNPALLSDYGTRYLLFIGIITLLGVMSTLVPLIVRFD